MSRPPPPRARGFTLLELIVVLLLGAVLATVAVPRLQAAYNLSGTGWREQVLAALRQARSVAVGHRRLVCASIATGSVTLTIATANPATACNAALAGADGNAAWARDSRAPTTTPSPATLYFQPDGRVTTDGAGTTAASASIAIAGETTVTLVGETGHVE